MDTVTFDELFLEWRPYIWRRVCGFVYRTGLYSEMEDYYQECCLTFIRALEDHRRYDGESDFESFLGVRLHTTLMDMLRRFSASRRDFRLESPLDSDQIESVGSKDRADIHHDLPILLSEVRGMLDLESNRIVFDEVFAPLVMGWKPKKGRTHPGQLCGMTALELAKRTNLSYPTVAKSLANIKSAVIMAADRLDLGDYISGTSFATGPPHEQIGCNKTTLQTDGDEGAGV